MGLATVRYIISILAPDRVGIIASVSRPIYELGGNLEAASQTIMKGWFTMILCAEFPADIGLERVKLAIESAGRLQVLVSPYEEARASAGADGEPFVVTVVGGDKPGIVLCLSNCFAHKGVNIEDVWNEVRDGQFIVIFHVTVPPTVDPKELRYELDLAAEQLGVAVRFQHQDIFTATNSLSVHTRHPSR